MTETELKSRSAGTPRFLPVRSFAVWIGESLRTSKPAYPLKSLSSNIADGATSVNGMFRTCASMILRRLEFAIWIVPPITAGGIAAGVIGVKVTLRPAAFIIPDRTAYKPADVLSKVEAAMVSDGSSWARTGSAAAAADAVSATAERRLMARGPVFAGGIMLLRASFRGAGKRVAENLQRCSLPACA
jgi:hypothetical protein